MRIGKLTLAYLLLAVTGIAGFELYDHGLLPWL